MKEMTTQRPAFYELDRAMVGGDDEITNDDLQTMAVLIEERTGIPTAAVTDSWNGARNDVDDKTGEPFEIPDDAWNAALKTYTAAVDARRRGTEAANE